MPDPNGFKKDIQDNRERVIRLEEAVKSINSSLLIISTKMDQLISKIDNIYASKEFVEAKMLLLRESISNTNDRIKPWSSGLSDVIKYIIIAIVGAILATLLSK